ncbi:GDSL-type esterase/lipase family protein [Rhodocytophaga aerolata]|uniref:GDSL-type esterase/lipase family protein n=1 Tax=Rhodocytophaga aerolata TaxID=455078 RepID=A0ABT8QYX6_9BACT|nr:GDSL-type esterase/lipase family protein [Rhodocytophaga aerolata]MDO1445042.1 GDSL-type esterase/lipase family protein [Rhodocytophaga aerolata]
MVKPSRSLLLLGYILIILANVTFFLPPEIKLTETISFRSFTPGSIFEKQEVKYADISDITQKFNQPDPLELPEKAAPAKKKKKTKAAVVKQQAPVKPDTTEVLETRYHIQFPEKADTVLDGFFQALRSSLPSKELIRVLHYGDSQIEGDRITSFLRRRLQEQYGGCGIGLIPAVDGSGTRLTLLQRADRAWSRTLAFGPDYNKTLPGSYGVLGTYYTYTPIRHLSQIKPTSGQSSYSREETTTNGKFDFSTAEPVSLELMPSDMAKGRSRQVKNLKLLYRNPGAPFQLSVTMAGDTVNKNIDSSGSLRIYKYRLKKDFETIRLSFKSKKSPELYALALDCNTGIAVDNIPFRGSSGTEFIRMNKNLLKQQLKELNVKFIILQFGVNIVPYLTSNFSFYEEQLYNQLELLKSVAPEVSILVVGVSDMSRKEGEDYVSYPNIEPIRDAQRRAAFKAGCAFWDLYEAMGGKNSMPSWVFAEPPLANKDFTHFTPKGARLVSEMLYKALMMAYEEKNRI